MTTIEPIDHRDAAVAALIHEVLALAHAQEAELLQPGDAPALQRSAEDLQASTAFYLGAIADGCLVGALSLGPDDEAGQIAVASLVVHPAHQRQGLARALLQEALRRAAGQVLSVTTAAGNAPALALYASCGFVAYRQGAMGPGAVPVVKLRRAAVPG